MALGNSFDMTAAAICITDFVELERAIGRPLPSSFKQHYLHFNGGAPFASQVPGNDGVESLDVAMFSPIKHALLGDAALELLRHYQIMRAKRVIPNYFLPFAWDPGENFFGLDLRDDTVVYYEPSLFSPAVAGNYMRAQRHIAKSFEYFLEILELPAHAIQLSAVA